MGLKSLVVVIVVYHGHILSGYEIETIFHYNYSLQLSLPMMKIEGMLHMHTSSCVEHYWLQLEDHSCILVI
jgi:hypothetical protein